MSANEKMPTDPYNPFYDSAMIMWSEDLQPCEISESELEKLINHLVPFDCDIMIEVTDIVEEYRFYADEDKPPYSVKFKHPKQAEEIEVVYTEKQVDELIETICDRLRSGFFKSLELKKMSIDRIKNEDYKHWKTTLQINNKRDE
jgi:hypothetical protein